MDNLCKCDLIMCDDRVCSSLRDAPNPNSHPLRSYFQIQTRKGCMRSKDTLILRCRSCLLTGLTPYVSLSRSSSMFKLNRRVALRKAAEMAGIFFDRFRLC